MRRHYPRLRRLRMTRRHGDQYCLNSPPVAAHCATGHCATEKVGHWLVPFSSIMKDKDAIVAILTAAPEPARAAGRSLPSQPAGLHWIGAPPLNWLITAMPFMMA